MPNYSTTLRNARAEEVNSAASGGKLRIYNGTKPAPGGAATTLLCEFNLASPAGTVSSAVLTFTDPADATVTNNGQATWARIVDSGGTWVADFTVSNMIESGEIKLTDDILAAGQILNVTSLTITEGNA